MLPTDFYFIHIFSFAKNLYLDRYPQMPNSGRASLPEQLWVYAARDASHPNLQTLPVVNDQLKLDDDGSLPCFALPTASPLWGHPDPLLGFPGHTKFFLMRHLGNTYSQSLGDGAIAHQARPTNELTLAVLANVVSPLLDFGFQSTIAKVILDTRSVYPPLQGCFGLEGWFLIGI